MTEAWKQWEGQVVNGEFHLRRYLGGGENSAVFRTELGGQESQKAAIKLLPASPEKSELQLSEWRLAAKLSHPHLIRLFQMGRCQMDDMELLYVVMEYAEEDLSQILPERRLTPEEAREMLEPVLDALTYVNGQGFVHGHIKPANIMAVEDQLKISSDGLRRVDEAWSGLEKPGVYDAPEMASGEISPAADVWSLGVTLVEALTQRLPVWEQPQQHEPALPEILPAPFLELVRHCLPRDPERRWTAGEIVAQLRQDSPLVQSRETVIPQETVAKRRFLVPAVAVGVVLAAVLAVPRLFNRQQTPSMVTPEAAKTTQKPDDIKQRAPQSTPASTPVQSEAESPAPTVGIVPRKVVHQVLPDVPRKARDTIQGKVRVGVRVRVDASGRVSGAKLNSAGPSKYFSGLALSAARRWKFDPAKVDDRNVSSEWILRFEFSKTGTKAVAARITP
jgi:TonB family protein